MKLVSTLVVLTLLATSAVHAQQASSLGDLLNQVDRSRADEQRALQAREAAFRKKQSDAQATLRQSNSRKAAAERRSASLESQFEANEQRIDEVQTQLDTRLGSLKELFGVLQQVAGDTQGQLHASLTSIQYPGRGTFLEELAKKMGVSSKLASIEEIEQLWFELQREATLQGKIEKFTTPVVRTGADGTQAVEQMEVIRVGAFNVIADGSYLKYDPESGNVVELPRQPPQPGYVAGTKNMFAAEPGQMVTFAVDPSRGGLLGALITTPTLVEKVKQGGSVGYVIIALGILGFLIALERFLVLSFTSGKVSSQLKASAPNPNNPLGRMLKVADDNKHKDMETLELKLSEAILQETPALNRALVLLKIISVVAPLLGLLGTVTGMIVTFQQITLFGTGDPKLMAGGISYALVTTVLGLVVAIPMVLLHNLVSSRSRRITHVLQEQAAGIIAQRAERGA